MLTPDQVAAKIEELENQEKKLWGDFNKVLGAKAAYTAMYQEMIKPEEAPKDSNNTPIEEGLK